MHGGVAGAEAPAPAGVSTFPGGMLPASASDVAVRERQAAKHAVLVPEQPTARALRRKEQDVLEHGTDRHVFGMAEQRVRRQQEGHFPHEVPRDGRSDL